MIRTQKRYRERERAKKRVLQCLMYWIFVLLVLIIIAWKAVLIFICFVFIWNFCCSLCGDIRSIDVFFVFIHFIYPKRISFILTAIRLSFTLSLFAYLLLLSLKKYWTAFNDDEDDDTMPMHDLYSFDIVIYIKSAVSSFQFYGCTTFICCCWCCYYYFNTYLCMSVSVQFTKLYVRMECIVWFYFCHATKHRIDPFTFSHEFIFNGFNPFSSHIFDKCFCICYCMLVSHLIHLCPSHTIIDSFSKSEQTMMVSTECFLKYVWPKYI